MDFFDVSVDLLDRMLPPPDATSDAEAVYRVRAAVQAIPGAKYVSLEVCRGVPGNPIWLRIYRPGNGEVMTGAEWDGMAERVEAAVSGALA